MSTSLWVHLGSVMHTVVCTGGVCGCQWLSMVPYGSLEHPCGLALNQRVYLWLHLEPSEQFHSMFSIVFTKEEPGWCLTKGKTELSLPLCLVGLQGGGWSAKTFKVCFANEKEPKKNILCQLGQLTAKRGVIEWRKNWW